MDIGFDNKKYIKIQSEHIMERMARFGNKLYLEFGGKLFDDFHAAGGGEGVGDSRAPSCPPPALLW